MGTATPPFDDLLRAAGSRRALGPLLRALGFEPVLEAVPWPAWPAFGLAEAPGLRALVQAGRAGTLDALLLELEAGAEPDAATSLIAAIRRRNPARLHLFLVADAGYRRLRVATYGHGDEFRHLTVDRSDIRPSDLDALAEMAPGPGEEGLELALRQLRALDRSRVTHRFFADFRSHRAAVADSWRGIPGSAERERRQLALLFLSRLTFLYFLQRRGALAGDDRYLVRLLARRDGDASFFRARLRPLFFGALNRRPADRSPEARALGPLPYLNGGLFEPHALERRYEDLDLPDPVVESVLAGLLERYRFTTTEARGGGELGAAYGVDPEVLGRVFEGLMEAGQRGDTGSFYTPAPVVHRVVREGLAEYVAGACPGLDAAALRRDGAGALDGESRYRARRALERVRILDPACGSGAFLLGALHHLAELRAAVSDEPSGAVRREIVARSLHGVDLLDDAALLCSLRLWLALAEDDHEIRPLPNLDRRIRQGDALVDPLDLGVAAPGDGTGGAAHDPMRDPALRRAVRAVAPAARRYLDSPPQERDAARAALARAERELATRWVRRLTGMEAQRARRLGAAAADRDLFGDVPAHARRAARALARSAEHRRELEEIGRALEEDGAVPFFSFGVHFADTGPGFDVIVSNPPWVRSHRWPDRLRRIAAARYEVCRDPGWGAATALTGAPAGAGAQVDLSLLFVERSIRLLAPGGVLAVLVPAKSLRALYGGAMRRILLRDLEFALIEDHALDQRSIFRADAFAAVLVGRRVAPAHATAREPSSAPEPSLAPESSPARTPAVARTHAPARVRMVRRGVSPLEFVVRPRDLPLFPDDPASPWILAPPPVVAALRAMQRAGEPLGRHPGLRVRRGVMTGANAQLVLVRAEPKLGGLCRIEAEGYRATRRSGGSGRAAGRFRAHVETAGVRPLVRGAEIDAFRYGTERYTIWCHSPDGGHAHPPPRLQRYLARHRETLEGRPGWRPGMPLGALFRLSPETLAPKVAWHDLSDTLRAVALPARVPFDGADVELVPLNTVYFVPVPRADDGVLLAGLLNSLPMRTFARAIAERAKDARFRFFAWTVSCLPLPAGWRDGAAAAEIGAISRRAHDRGGIAPDQQARLDVAAAVLFGLADAHVSALAEFDRWLRGRP